MFFIVDKWCVIIIDVFFFIKLLSVCWISFLDLVLRVDVVLLRIKIGVFFKMVCVIVICWCWLLDNIMLFLFIMVFKFFGKFLINF